MPRYDVFLEGRTESSTCYFGVAVMADDQKEAEYLGHEAGRKKHRECDEIEVVSVRLRQAGKRRLCQCVPLKERALNLVKEAIANGRKKGSLTPTNWKKRPSTSPGRRALRVTRFHSG